VGNSEAEELTAADLHELVGLAEELARAAGTVLRGRPDDLGVSTKSTPTDVVTVMDKAAETVILDGLAARRPGDAIVSEESAAQDGETGVRWLVDPLDGTVNYLYAIPQYAVSIAAEVDGVVACGVVYDVERDELYRAVAGSGARLGTRRLGCSAQGDPAFALVGTGFNYDREVRAAQATVLTSVLPQVRDIRRAGSAALDLCSVAAGRLDAFYEAGMYPWDWAAGGLIVTEAGGRIGGLEGKPPGRHTTLAASPVLFDRMHDLLVSSRADDASPRG
jgi:myo-inositol-1(or 4)-monophosphatase